MRLAKAAAFFASLIIAGLTMQGCGPNCTGKSVSGSGSGGTGGVTHSNVCGPPTIGGGGTVSAGNAAVLVYQVPGSSVAAAGLTASGTFGQLSGFTSPTVSGSGSDQLTIVSKKFLYIPQAGSLTVEGFAINRTTGGLTPLPGSPVAVSSGSDTIASDPQGRFLFMGNESGNGIAAFQIDPATGALTASPNSPYTTAIGSVDVFTVDGNGKFLYVGEQDNFAPVHGFAIDQTTGELTALPWTSAFLNIATPHADPSGKFLLGVPGFSDQGSGTTDLHIYVYSIDPVTGFPSPVISSPTTTTASPQELAIHPNGKFVYVMETNASGTPTAMEGFAMDAAGALTPLLNSPFTLLPSVGECKFNQGGTHLICTNTYLGSTLVVFNVDPVTGAVTNTVTSLTLSGGPFAVTE
jgi:6-phosphogluconolactonase (cycloisomerase 2 family)